MSIRQDFVDAYTQTFLCSKEFADSLLRGVETDYADQENRQLQDLVDTEAVRHMQSQDMAALRGETDDWKGRESAARGTLVRIADLLGYQEITPLLVTGRYEEALALLDEKTGTERKGDEEDGWVDRPSVPCAQPRGHGSRR